MKKLIFCDTNIFIDLCTMRLVKEFSMLPYEIHSTDMVLREIEPSNQKETILSVIEMGKLEISQTLLECISDVVNLMKSNLSITDAAVWYHAKQQSALLLTGDNRLRKLAEADNVHVAGILFVLDSLVENHIISAGYAAKCLELLKKTNRRLLQSEVDKRLREWTQIMEGKTM